MWTNCCLNAVDSVENCSSDNHEQEVNNPTTILIAGGGIAGLTLAMSIYKQLGIRPEIYEKTKTFATEAGAALGMYPNGLRVIRDISPELLKDVRAAGWPYKQRVWERHDGTEVARADECILSSGDDELDSIGIRRYTLQKVLYKHALDLGIVIHFSKPLVAATERKDGLIEVAFGDGTTRLTQVLMGADGALGKARSIVAEDDEPGLAYTGTTCLMGLANVSCDGIYFPSSGRDDFHAVFFPTGEREMCFQLHCPVSEEESNALNWGNLSDEVAKVECKKIADQLRDEGWHEKYVAPLENCIKAVRVGFALLEPRLKRWVKGKMVLVGDAAHPPVPYVGQGAQQGLEDAAVAVSLLKFFCLDDSGKFDPTNFENAMKIYQNIRIKRSSQILDISKSLGQMQSDRAGEGLEKKAHDVLLQGQVAMFGTIPVLMEGSDHDYKEDVVRATQKLKLPKFSTEALLESLHYLMDDAQDVEVAPEKDTNPIVRSKMRRRMSDAAYTLPAGRVDYLCNWVVDVLATLIKEIVARRNILTNKATQGPLDDSRVFNDSTSEVGQTVVDEVCEVIEFAEPNTDKSFLEEDPDSIELPDEVIQQLRDYVTGVACMYHSNPFHNWEHACNVTMNLFKLLSRMATSTGDSLTVSDKALDTIIGDPLIEFACIFAALFHDADHDGVPNSQLAKEHPEWAEIYKGRSIAEQNSLDLAWSLFMRPKYQKLRSIIYTTEEELKRLRQLVVNIILATDIADKPLKQLRDARWEKSFAEESKDDQEAVNRRATIGIETLIQASDIAHTMQPWHVYRRWNQNLYEEMYKAYKEGRADKDPGEFWFKGEIGFFEFYIIPLAKKVTDCGLFGTAGEELLENAKKNKEEWLMEGESVVADMISKLR